MKVLSKKLVFMILVRSELEFVYNSLGWNKRGE